ncbi:hypothetical protein OIU76_029674 [Salix suchowensis]|nr:hypothetical protein OIU76_029674 [Salix suchowensis]KAJ6368266.1 hypothetical protein OIU78_000786 [Salix suchowensis]
MPSHHWYVHINKLEVFLQSNKCICPHNIKCSDAKELLWIIHTLLLQNFSSNWHCRVDWIADNVDESIRAVVGHSLNQSLHYVGIDVEEVITSHTRLPWNPSRYDNNIDTLQRIG